MTSFPCHLDESHTRQPDIWVEVEMKLEPKPCANGL